MGAAAAVVVVLCLAVLGLTSAKDLDLELATANKTGRVFSLFRLIIFVIILSYILMYYLSALYNSPMQLAPQHQALIAMGENKIKTKLILIIILSRTCFTASECSSKGGSAQGNCAAGFGVCCICELLLLSDAFSYVSLLKSLFLQLDQKLLKIAPILSTRVFRGWKKNI